MAQPYLVSNLNNIVGDFSHINSVVTQNITNRALNGDSDHNFISHIRLLMTAFVWGLAFIGGVMRLRKGYRDATYVLLALSHPFPVLLVQSYGGEMLLRIYLFTLPMMTFFIAAIFFTPSSRKGFALDESGHTYYVLCSARGILFYPLWERKYGLYDAAGTGWCALSL